MCIFSLFPDNIPCERKQEFRKERRNFSRELASSSVYQGSKMKRESEKSGHFMKVRDSDGSAM